VYAGTVAEVALATPPPCEAQFNLKYLF